jgi:hypothetical protein
VAIYRLLQGQAFDPEAVECLTAAVARRIWPQYTMAPRSRHRGSGKHGLRLRRRGRMFATAS